MRRLVYILMVLAIAAGVHYCSSGREEKKIRRPIMSAPHSVREMLENAPVVVSEHEFIVSLDHGKGTFERGSIRGAITLGDSFAAAKTPEGTDFLGYIVVNFGGSGNFRYLVLYSTTKQGLTHHDSAFLGDRIIVQSIQTVQQPEKEEYRVIVTIRDRKPDEPMSAPPGIERKMTFTVSGHRLFMEKD
jgi:hypothetical protein